MFNRTASRTNVSLTLPPSELLVVNSYGMCILTIQDHSKSSTFATKNCHPHHCLANSRTIQDLASRFPGLSRSWKFSSKNFRTFQDFPGGVENLSTFQWKQHDLSFSCFLTIHSRHRQMTLHVNAIAAFGLKQHNAAACITRRTMRDANPNLFLALHQLTSGVIGSRSSYSSP